MAAGDKISTSAVTHTHTACCGAVPLRAPVAGTYAAAARLWISSSDRAWIPEGTGSACLPSRWQCDLSLRPGTPGRCVGLSQSQARQPDSLYGLFPSIWHSGAAPKAASSPHVRPTRPCCACGCRAAVPPPPPHQATKCVGPMPNAKCHAPSRSLIILSLLVYLPASCSCSTSSPSMASPPIPSQRHAALAIAIRCYCMRSTPRPLPQFLPSF